MHAIPYRKRIRLCHAAARLLLLLWAILPCLSLAGCSSGEDMEKARLVRSMTVSLSKENSCPALTGQVAAHTLVAASFRVSGKIAERLAYSGDAVQKGQVLAILDKTILNNAWISAKAQTAAARAAFIQAEQHNARVQGLLRERAVSKENAEASVRQARSSRASLEAAEASEASALEQLGYAELKAEKDGIIVDRLAEAGEVVSAGQPVFRIALHEGRDAVFDVPAMLLSDLSAGQAVEACLDRSPDICSRATVYEVSPEADAATRTHRTRAHIDKPDQMDLGAALTVRPLREEEAIRIPFAALANVDGSPCVWVIDAKTMQVSPRKVAIGGYSADTVTVSSGLKEGERIVTAGVQLLQEGQKVRTE